MLKKMMMWKFKLFVVFFTLIYILSFTPTMADSLTLIWDENHEDDLAGYRVYRGTQSLKYDWYEFVGNITKFEINGLQTGVQYYFAVSALDYWGNESELSAEVYGSIGDSTTQYYEFALYPSVPNPFPASGGNPKTMIKFSVPEKANIKLEIVNALGQKVRTLFNGAKETGLHTMFWDGSNDNGQILSSGVYFCSLAMPNQRISKPITFLH